MSIAGGYHNAVIAARSHGCQALQLFTKNSNQWAAKELTDEEVRLFRRKLRGSAVPALKDVLKDKDRQLQHRAGWALKVIDPKAAAEAGIKEESKKQPNRTGNPFK
jgi:hypothetical protein